MEQIQTIKDQTLAVMASVTANPKPSYDVGGQKVQWAEYLTQLRSTVDWCDDQLQALEPFEVQMRAFT